MNEEAHCPARRQAGDTDNTDQQPDSYRVCHSDGDFFI